MKSKLLKIVKDVFLVDAFVFYFHFFRKKSGFFISIVLEIIVFGVLGYFSFFGSSAFDFAIVYPFFYFISLLSGIDLVLSSKKHKVVLCSDK